MAPPVWRELRELVRYRAKLVHLRAGLKAQVHAVLAKEGVAVPMSDLFGAAGRVLLDTTELAPAYTVRVESLRDLLEVVEREIAMLAGRVEAWLADDAGYRAIQALPGVGPVLAAVFVAEIGDVSRFPSARHLCSWAGLTPTHRESDTTVRRGHITSRDRAWCAGRPWRPSPASAATPPSALLRPARRRDRLPGRRRVTGPDAARRVLANCHGPPPAERPSI